MLYIESPSNDPYFNLALEEYLLLNKQDEIFMLWQNKSAIIVGKNQNTMAEIDYAYVTEHNIPVVRRLTGGGAVYHDMGNLNFSYIVNRDTYGDYIGFTKVLRDYLATLGLSAEVSGRNDVLMNGKKISGNAQCVSHGRMLHHGCILLGADMTHLAHALCPDESKIQSKGIRSVKSRVVNISDFIPITTDEFYKGFADFAIDEMKLVLYILKDFDLQAVETLKNEKYSTFSWNYGYSPKYAFHTKQRFSGGGIEVFLDIQDGVIRDAKIYGDFLADGDTLAKLLCGIPHSAESIKNAICGFKLDTITETELLSCLI